MRIAIVADDLYPGFGGQAAATEGHIGALLGRGHQVRVLAGSQPETSKVPRGVLVTRVPSWQPGEKQTRFAWPDRDALDSLLAWADVVQSNTPTPLTLMVTRRARARQVPSVIGFHTQEESATYHAGLLKPLVSPSLRGWYRFLYRQPDCLIAPTPFAAQIAKSYTDKPIFVVSNGIRFPERVDDARRVATRASYLPSGARYLLTYVGRLAKEKRPERLLELFMELRKHRDDVHLAIAGRGPLQRDLRHLAQKRSLTDEVSFLGFVSEHEKSDLLWASDLFVMPSPTELQSIATLEAMARLCAIVTVDDPSSAVGETVRTAEAGLAYAATDPAGAAVKVHRLLDDPAQLASLQERARSFAAQHDTSESGRQLERIYVSLRDHHLDGAHVPELGIQL